jgi:glycosyltransferase involved in cell wall biosynthesis
VDINGKSVAIVHDWLPTIGGAEKVLKELFKLFPNADLFTLVSLLDDKQLEYIGASAKITTSWIQRYSFLRGRYQALLPVLPITIEQFNLEKYDVIISNSYAVAKGVIVHPHQFHICYCCSPIRYAWDMQETYIENSRTRVWPLNIFVRILMHYIRIWDVRSSNGVDKFITLSDFVARRIQKTYRRDSTVVYPPVDVNRFTPRTPRRDYFVTASRLINYKRIDLIVEAFKQLPELKLKVVGSGPEEKRLREKSRDCRNIEILGFKPDNELEDIISRARGFIFAAKEDFGIAPVEAQSAGVPVIAFGKGGAAETILEMQTGILYQEQSVRSIVDAVFRFLKVEHLFNSNDIKQNAMRFSDEVFRRRFADEVQEGLRSWDSNSK